MLEFVVAHLPALQVVVPLIAAPILVLVQREWFAWSVALLVTWATFALSALLVHQVFILEVVSYDLGGWAPPLGIEYRVDAANALVIAIVAGIAALATTYARASIQAEIPRRNQPLFYVLLLLCVSGLIGVAITGDAFNLFVFLEISSLSTYTMVALGGKRDRRAYTAAIRYLITGTIGATFYVIGVGLLYMVTGTLNMADLAASISDLGDNQALQAGFAFIIIGLGLKVAMFPLHLWLPNAYTYAPSVVTVFLAATSTKVAVYALMRFLFTVFGIRFGFELDSLAYIFLPLALMGMFIPSIVAAFQVDVKRLLAYSSVSQIGYMLLGISLATSASLTASSIHLFNHALMKAALFMALGAIMLRVKSTLIDDMSGIGKTMPWTTAAFVLAGLSLIGVPLTVGFVSKWLLIQAAFSSHQPWLAGLIVLSSLIAVVYIWRVVEVAYLSPVPEGHAHKEAPLSMLVPMWVLVAANIYFGVDTDLTIRLASLAAEALLGGAP